MNGGKGGREAEEGEEGKRSCVQKYNRTHTIFNQHYPSCPSRFLVSHLRGKAHDLQTGEVDLFAQLVHGDVTGCRDEDLPLLLHRQVVHHRRRRDRLPRPRRSLEETEERDDRVQYGASVSYGASVGYGARLQLGEECRVPVVHVSRA